jgi:hypothetical protein
VGKLGRFSLLGLFTIPLNSIVCDVCGVPIQTTASPQAGNFGAYVRLGCLARFVDFGSYSLFVRAPVAPNHHAILLGIN